PKKQQQPAGVRFRTSRAADIAWATLSGFVTLTAFSLKDSPDGDIIRYTAMVVALVFALWTVRLVTSALSPRLGLDIGPDGLTVSCGANERKLPWYAVSRVKVMYRRGKPWLVVWLVNAAGEPETLGHGTFRPYKGGYRAYPVSHDRGKARQGHDVGELRSALAWYASSSFDPR
ncbi:MAG: serine/threonine protein kinase, partial [Umezawaea sp.]